MRSGAEGGRCPHCKAEVPKDHGRTCVECGGSLQKRYLSIGCLSSKPIILIAIGLPLWLAGGDEDLQAAEQPDCSVQAIADRSTVDANDAAEVEAQPTPPQQAAQESPAHRSQCAERDGSSGTRSGILPPR